MAASGDDLFDGVHGVAEFGIGAGGSGGLHDAHVAAGAALGEIGVPSGIEYDDRLDDFQRSHSPRGVRVPISFQAIGSSGWGRFLLVRVLPFLAILIGWQGCGFSQYLIAEKQLYAKETRFASTHFDEQVFLTTAQSFLREAGARSVKYLRATSFPRELPPANGSLFPEQSFELFVRRLDRLRAAEGCQLEVLSIEPDAAMRWSCSGDRHGSRVLQGKDPFDQPAGVIFFVRMHVGLGLRVPTFELYTWADKPAVVAARETLERLIRTDKEIDWRVVVAPHPWLFRDNRYSEYNPFLLQYATPERAPASGSAGIRMRFDVRHHEIVEWVEPGLR